MAEHLFSKTAAELAGLLQAGRVSSREIMAAFIERTESVDSRVKAFHSWQAESALSLAEESDERRAKGAVRGALDGLPVGIKDVIAVKGHPLTCSSRMLEAFVSPYDAGCIERLYGAGAIPWGRLNMDEFAMGSSTENSAFATTANPWDTERIPGGSSGGSAACVAALEAPFSLGSDTGGSIRQPAALCGVVGVKPTYGSVSRYGLVAFASSLDQIGPFARTVEDAAMLLQAIMGQDKRDSTSLDRPMPDLMAAVREPRAKKWRIGVPRDWFAEEGMADDVRTAVEAVIDYYRSEGCEIVDIALPHSHLSIPVYYIIATAEASSNLARYDGVRYTHRSDSVSDAIDLYAKSRAEGFGEEVKRRIILGTYVLSSGYYDAYYLRAQKVRTLIRRDFEAAFEAVDAVLTPTTPTVAFKRGEKAADPLSMYLSDTFTIAANLAGLPGMSVPCGFNAEGLPIGFQLMAPDYQEADLFSIARLYEAEHEHWRQTAAL